MLDELFDKSLESGASQNELAEMFAECRLDKDDDVQSEFQAALCEERKEGFRDGLRMALCLVNELG